MKVKKIAALAVGAAMLGATAGFASAVHMPNTMPQKSFFVNSNGTPNVKIVVGSQGAAQDVVGAADIAVAIGTLMYNQKEAEASGPAVFKQLPYEVGEIPVYMSNATYVQVSPNEQVLMPNPVHADNESVLSDVASDYWYNGASYTGNESSWEDWWNNFNETLWLGDFEKVIGQVPSGNWQAALDNATANVPVKVTITKIELVGAKDYPTGKEKIMVPKGDFQYVANYTEPVRKWVSGSCCGQGKWEVKAGKNPGIRPGDSFTLLGKKYHVICVYGNYTAGRDLATICPTCVAVGNKEYAMLLASDAIEGQAGWVSVGGNLTIGPNDRYTINVLDINIVGTEKVLLKVHDNKLGETKTVSIAKGSAISVWGDRDGDGADDIVIILDGTFIGVNSHTMARLLVYTDLRAVNNGTTSWPEPGWTVSFEGHVYNSTAGEWEFPNVPGGAWNTSAIIALGPADGITEKAVAAIKLVNSGDLPSKNGATKIDIPTVNPVYALIYKTDICQGKCKATDDYVYRAKAWIELDKVGGLLTKEIKVGDELQGYKLVSLGEINSVTPVKVTNPIVELDSEVMAQGLDKVSSNLILVGGPVVNSVTAALADKLGVPSNYDGWKSTYGTGADSGVIQYVQKCSAIGGYGVLLVAGTDRQGTQAAAEALMKYLAGL